MAFLLICDSKLDFLSVFFFWGVSFFFIVTGVQYRTSHVFPAKEMLDLSQSFRINKVRRKGRSSKLVLVS